MTTRSAPLAALLALVLLLPACQAFVGSGGATLPAQPASTAGTTAPSDGTIGQELAIEAALYVSDSITEPEVVGTEFGLWQDIQLPETALVHEGPVWIVTVEGTYTPYGCPLRTGADPPPCPSGPGTEQAVVDAQTGLVLIVHIESSG